MLETKILINLMVLCIPLPFFWALFDQQGSRWVTQAKRLNPYVGSIEILPDQIQLANPLLILIFIPLYEVAFYPFLSVLMIRRPLQKMALGGIFAGFSFICSMLLQMEIDRYGDGEVSILWQLPQYIVMTLAEVTIYDFP